MRQLPPLNALRAFEAAGRHQSFAAAADELGVTHSSISRHVRGLEDRLGVALFADLPRGVRLTRLGAAYLDEVTPALDRVADATAMLADRGAGVLTISCEPLFATRWLIARLHRFQSLAPEVEVRLDATEEVVDVRRHAADLAIRFYKSAEPDRPTDLLSDLPIYPFATPDIAERVTRPEDLLHLPRLQDRYGDMWGDWFAMAGVDTAGHRTEPAWRMRAALSCEAALAGQGVFLVGEEVVLDLVEAGRLVRLSDIGLRRGAYHLVQGETARHNRAAMAFRRWLLEESGTLRDGKVN
ncbi:LysR substrate-binding domain-containing protein [Pseudaestuariivita atlantica]|uniref:HTH lysR-type domain-containing protein n=1 Tax=Pseudaestuariivita atlantica TaxID=1317121 RepID=A0A0L1JSH7_9RHOB|nr:LysR substrate-binding domain-containing protein [Pseudaestuariivita atlantica]KNG94739.1 hypothetical protein ATO11_04935 [Pseudaestuariivita atlantica]